MKNVRNYLLLAFSFAAVVVACKSNPDPTPDPTGNGSTLYIPPATMVTAIPASTQRSGDVNKGYDYLINGNYVSSGLPLSIYKALGQQLGNNELNRTGDAANIPYSFNLTKYSNGVDVISPNCLQCHAQTLNNQLVIGLGTTTYDFTKGQIYGGSAVGVTSSSLAFAAQAIQNRSQSEYDAFKPFYDAVNATSPYLVNDVVGANSAAKLAAVLGVSRDKSSLKWLGGPQSDPGTDVYPTDVPAWWLMKKKNAMFFAGWGRGDLARIMMASGLLTMKDSTEARQIDNRFPDVFAYLKALTPPKYTQTIDQTLIAQGKKVFTNACSSCHGTYESGNVTYPNYLVSVDLVGTDASLIKDNFHKTQFIDWYNSSWFANSKPSARFENTQGYIAPPLDGVWATAPYLHNGSVPTLDDLLNSSQRPKFWRKIIDNATSTIKLEAYDYKKVGWQYTTEGSKTDKFTYDTTKPGYGNQGHSFGDGLSAADRKAVIEYLKTL